MEEWKREKKTRENNTRRKSAISNQSVGSTNNLEEFLTTPGIDNRRRGSAYAMTGRRIWKDEKLIK